MKQKIFLLDDHPIIINGIEKFLSSIPSIELVGICSTPQQAFHQIVEANPDILVFDYQLPGTTGLDIFNKVRLTLPSLKGICYTQHCEGWIVQNILKAKVNGIVLKSEDPEQLSSAILALSQGEDYHSPLIMKAICSTYTQTQNLNLTKRELEVIRLIAEELSSKEIADRINLSVNTVEDYRKNLMLKLGVKNTAGLMLKASKMGVV
jgi:Response regulator containing a CheY-like receiver domain and an HTH DNA-binding domain